MTMLDGNGGGRLTVEDLTDGIADGRALHRVVSLTHARGLDDSAEGKEVQKVRSGAFRML